MNAVFWLRQPRNTRKERKTMARLSLSRFHCVAVFVGGNTSITTLFQILVVLGLENDFSKLASADPWEYNLSPHSGVKLSVIRVSPQAWLAPTFSSFRRATFTCLNFNGIVSCTRWSLSQSSDTSFVTCLVVIKMAGS